jgi:metal-responsive CopG/Arc/MetJ family transcriptional regulator
MDTTTVNISFRPALLAEIDQVARAESRSRSELLREAARLYIERRRRWNRIFSLGRSLAAGRKLTRSDVAAEIRAYRREKAQGR